MATKTKVQLILAFVAGLVTSMLLFFIYTLSVPNNVSSSASIHIIQSDDNEYIKLAKQSIDTLLDENEKIKQQLEGVQVKLNQKTYYLNKRNKEIQQLKTDIQQLQSNTSNLISTTETKQINSDKLNHKDQDINFIKSMRNAVTQETIQCNPYKHKYIHHLLNQLQSSQLIKTRKKTTSSDLNNDMQQWKNSTWFKRKKLRVQIIDGKIYVSGDFMNEYDDEGYRSPAMLFLHALMTKYSEYIPNTDFIWYYHDYKGYDYEHRYIINNTIPYIWCDHNMARNDGPLGDIFFLSVSRGWLKYRYLVDLYNHPNYAHLNLRNKDNKYSIIDYRRFAQFYKSDAKYRDEELNWKYKKYNKAVFRGWKGNGRGIRGNLMYTLENITFFRDTIMFKYFNVSDTEPYGLLKDRARGLSIREQIAYRYMIVMDGVTVRDSLIYQMLYGSVLLKQLSTMYEYFYWDLKNEYHLIIWENIIDLINIVINLVDTMDVYLNKNDGFRMKQMMSNGTFDDEFEYLYKQNLTHYNNEKLEEITRNSKKFIHEYLNDDAVDCYMIHLLQVYNEYVFDVNSLEKSKDEIMQELYINVTHDFDVDSALMYHSLYSSQ